MGYAIGLVSPILRGRCRFPQKTSKFTRTLAKKRLGGEAYAPGGMIDHVAFLGEFFARFVDLSPGMVGFGDCEDHR